MFLALGHAIDPQTGQNREMPWEYVQLRLCRDIYHCRPSELDEEDWETVKTHIEIVNLEAEIANQKK